MTPKKSKASTQSSRKESGQHDRPPAGAATGSDDSTARESAPKDAAETPKEESKATPETVIAELNDKLLRTKAEFDNYRKRVQREYADIREQTKILVISEFLTVYDHFQMALSHAESDDVESLRQGMELIQAELRRTLDTLGTKEIEALGQPFDPEAHEAIAQEPSAEIPEGHVLRQWKAGFRIGERLLRPAVVVVSAGAAESDPSATGAS